MSTKINVATGANDPSSQGKEDKQKKVGNRNVASHRYVKVRQRWASHPFVT